MGKKRIHLKVYGMVQGVSFRYYTVEQAQSLNLSGWVRNAPQGSVEILAEGEKENLEKLLSWARRGPGWAEVKNVEVEWEKTTGEFEGFRIIY